MTTTVPAERRIIVSVTSDLSTDQRVHRSCLELQKQGFKVLLVGRKLPGSPPVPERSYTTLRFRLWFHKGALFYANYNLRLFFFLLVKKTNAFFSNDLDSLTANFLMAKLRNKTLVYDSHEYYTGVPELENRPFVKGIWKMLERWMFPRLKTIITVNDSIAGLYSKEYGKKIIVIRNVPLLPSTASIKFNRAHLREEIGIPEGKKLAILQGSGINIQRGGEEAVEAMRYLEDVCLLVLGGGDVMPVLNEIVRKYQLEKKVFFKPRMPYGEMMKHTMASDIGLTFDKDTNLNYRYSLPNKIFDYIHAGIPVLASRLPEVEKVITTYDIGAFIDSHDPVHIASRLQNILHDNETLSRWKENLKRAAGELNWETESKKFPVIE